VIKQLSSKLSSPTELFFIASLVISPLLLLSVAGWMTRIVVVCAVLAIFVLYKNKSQAQLFSSNKQADFYTTLLCITLALPTLAILLGQIFRGHFVASYYDSPAHILICVFVLLAAAKTGASTVKWMSYILPIALLIALAYILIAPNLFWGSTRLTTKALDPLEFGSLSLTFGLLSLISIKLDTIHSRWLIAYKLIGFAVGVYLSIASGSRTGWMALPIAGLIWLYYDHDKLPLKTKILAIISSILLILSIYLLSVNIQQRINETIKDITSYQWNTDKPQDYNSSGARIAFARMAVFLFEQRPLSGWGDGGFESVINDPALNFSKPETKRIALEAGFHNDITANMVRSGIWGLIATVALFLIPAIFFMRNLSSPHKNQRDVAFLAIAFLSCQFISSISMEILTLKYSASFYGLMIAILSGQILFYNTHHLTNPNGKLL
jgi:O-antigen ligase